MKKIFPATKILIILLSLVILLCLTAFLPGPRLPGVQIAQMPTGLVLAQVTEPVPVPVDGLTDIQVMVIGVIVMVAAQGIKLLFAALKKPLDRKWITWGLLVLALVLAYFWKTPALPTLPTFTGDPGQIVLSVLTFVSGLVTVAASLVGFGMVIYNIAVEKVFNILGIGKDALTKMSK